MSKINKAIGEIQNLTQMAEQDQWMNRIHPLVKLLLTVMYIGVTVSFDKYDFSGVLSMAVYPIIIFILSDLSFKNALYRMRVVLPMVCIVGVFNPFFDKEVAGYIELGTTADGVMRTLVVTGGVISMLSLMVKGFLTVMAAYILIATTTIEKICYALRLIHVPKIIVTEILLIYRYITLLLTEAKRVVQAYALRAPGQNGIKFSAWGSLVGQMLIRSMDRAENVYDSMCLRGFDGEFFIGEKVAFRGRDAAFLLSGIVVFVVFRCFPVFEMVGELF